MHRPLNDDDSSSEEEEEEDIRLCHFRGCISVAATGGEGLCDGHSRSICGNDEWGRNKRARPSEDSISDNDMRKRQAFTIDLTGVPPQPTIPKSCGRIKDGASKYTGVSFSKKVINGWHKS